MFFFFFLLLFKNNRFIVFETKKPLSSGSKSEPRVLKNLFVQQKTKEKCSNNKETVHHTGGLQQKQAFHC